VVIVDKHSSGGVGDKTTLAVAPIAAACGLPVGKMSGRGLSFSGGTIDKLESIAGWTAEISEEHFRRQVREIGLVVAAQTANLAPADKHALRAARCHRHRAQPAADRGQHHEQETRRRRRRHRARRQGAGAARSWRRSTTPARWAG
jgi:hypothetical protein